MIEYKILKHEISNMSYVTLKNLYRQYKEKAKISNDYYNMYSILLNEIKYRNLRRVC